MILLDGLRIRLLRNPNLGNLKMIKFNVAGNKLE